MTQACPGRSAVLLVTGGTGGVGLEICAQATEAWPRLIVHGSRPETCRVAIDKLHERTPNRGLTPLPANLTKDGAATTLIERAAALHGRLDAVIHCAIPGSPQRAVVGPLSRTNPNDYGAFLAQGVSTFQEICHAALPHLSVTNGAIVAFASDSGRYAAARQSLIGAHMAAIMGFVRNASLEIARDGVRINCISPSYITETPIFERFASADDGRAQRAAARAGLGLPTPRDIAPLALFLAGPDSAKITGQIVSVNGGLNA